MGNLLCMGLKIPSPWGLDIPNHRLTAGVHVDVLHQDFLLTLAAVTIVRVEILVSDFEKITLEDKIEFRR
jgi:hypothetical protein